MAKAPFPYFGGKARVARVVWSRFGNVPNYVEPFFGSGAVLLARPHTAETRGIETVNDLDGLISNFWRAVQWSPAEVAHWASWPVNECDLHARHLYLLARKDGLAPRLMADPEWHDAKIAGWWLWGICQWIGAGWCSGNGPWTAESFLREAGERGDDGAPGVVGGDAGMGIKRQMPHLGDAGMGIKRQMPHLGDAGRGINRQMPHAPDEQMGECAQWSLHLRNVMGALSDRLIRVRVCCGDWTRALGASPTIKQGLTGVFLDPPYAFLERTQELYRTDTDVSAAVREWALAHGDDPRFRIALCGYDGEHEMPSTWEAHAWKAHGGYGSQGNGLGRENASREVVWFSPHCLRVDRAVQASFLE